MADDRLRHELQADPAPRLRDRRERRRHRAPGAAPQHQVNPRVQDVRGRVAHHGVQVLAQLSLLRVFLAEQVVALDVGEVALLPEHRALVLLVRHAHLRDQRQRRVRQRLPGRERLGVARRVQARQHPRVGARRRLLQRHDPRLPFPLALGRRFVRAEDPRPLARRPRRHAQHLLAHRQLVVVAPGVALPRLQQAGDFPLDAGAVQPLVTHARHVQDALAQHAQFFELLGHPRQHRFRHPVQVAQQLVLGAKQRQAPLPSPQVGDRRRQPRRHQRRRVAQPPAPGAVGVRHALFHVRFLELVEAVQVRRVLAEVRPPLHPVGRRHVHDHLDRRPRNQAAEQALEHHRHLLHRGVRDRPHVARPHLPHAAQAGVLSGSSAPAAG